MNVEIWTDEAKGNCTYCNTVFQKNDTAKTVDDQQFRQNVGKALEKLTQLACQSGASDARAICTTDISVEDDLANLCREPGCKNYGLSASCPPLLQDRMDFENY